MILNFTEDKPKNFYASGIRPVRGKWERYRILVDNKGIAYASVNDRHMAIFNNLEDCIAFCNKDFRSKYSELSIQSKINMLDLVDEEDRCTNHPDAKKILSEANYVCSECVKSLINDNQIEFFNILEGKL